MRVARSLRSPLWRWLVICSALFCLSCSGGSGPGLHSVQGKVLYKNEPAQGVLLTFHPKTGNDVTTVRPTGLSKKDGTFSLTTGQADGAAVGEYTVTIFWPEEVAPPKKMTMNMEPPDAKDRLKGAYSDRTKSQFKVEIKSGSNQLEPFQLK